MPLLFYFPFIVWMGMVKVVQDEMRVPQPAHDLHQPKVTHRACVAESTGCHLPSAISILVVVGDFDFSIFGHRQQTRRFRQTRRNVELVKQDLTASSVESERSRGP